MQTPELKKTGEDTHDEKTINDIIQAMMQKVKVTFADMAPAPFPLLATDYWVEVNASGGACEVELPLVSDVKGKSVMVIKTDNSVNTVTVKAKSGDNVNSSASLVLSTQRAWSLFNADSSLNWTGIQPGGGGGGGSVSGAANVGATGEGIFKQLNGSTLEFYKLLAASTKIAIARVGDNVTIDAVEAQFDHGNIGGIVPVAKGGHGMTTASAGFGALSPISTLGAIISHDGSVNIEILGNTAPTRKFLMSLGNGTISALPVWEALALGDMPSGVLRNDVDNDLGAHQLLQQEIAEPATPPANKVAIYPDSADGHVKAKKDDGSVVDLEAASSSSTYTVSDIKTGNYTATSSDQVIQCGSGTFTISLNALASYPAGKWFKIKKLAGTTGITSVTAAVGELIEDQNSVDLDAKEILYIIKGTNGWIGVV